MPLKKVIDRLGVYQQTLVFIKLLTDFFRYSYRSKSSEDINNYFVKKI